MWCSNCQQDVPGVASSDEERRVCCARCGEAISSSALRHGSSADKTPATDDETEHDSDIELNGISSDKPPVDLDDWEFEEDLQAVERLMRSLRTAGMLDTFGSESSSSHRHESAHSSVPDWHTESQSALTSTASQAGQKRKKRKKRSTFVAWTFLSFGLMTFVCGAVLLGWSFVEGREELWTVGLPLTLGGQAVLLVGLLFQLETLWQSNQETTSTLDDLDEQLHELRHTTTLLNSSRNSSAQSFYVHMAEGASPQMLLSDLKGQLDMLAVRIANEKR